MAIYVPTISTPYMMRAFFENEKWAQLLATGVLDVGTLAASASKGDYVDVPKMNVAQDFARIDISSATPLTFVAASTSNDKAVVLRDASPNKYLWHDVVRSGENFGNLLGQSFGEKMAKRLLSQTCNMLTGAIDGVDTPSANYHTHDLSSAALTVEGLRDAKQKMRDNADQLHTLVCHSAVFSDLGYDILTNFKSNDIFGGAFQLNGTAASILGIRNIIVTDLCTNSGVGTGSAGDDRYHSYLLGDGAIYLAFQRPVTSHSDVDVTTPSDTVNIKASLDYVLSLRGMAWGGSNNPADADYGTAANWNESYEDHREVRAVLIKSNGNVN